MKNSCCFLLLAVVLSACGTTTSSSLRDASRSMDAAEASVEEADASVPDAWISLQGDGGSFVWPDSDPGDATTQSSFSDASTVAPMATSCTGKAAIRAGDRTLTVRSGGLLRTALVHTPSSYDPTRGTMVVLNFHGFSSDAIQEAFLTRMNAASDRRNFVVVYPFGVANSWNAGQCCGTAWADAVDDVGFVRDLLNQIESEYCVDRARVFATGMSNGGFISHRLGCELSDRIAALAPVAGVLGIPRERCRPSRAVPVLQFHGTDDGLVPYLGGTPALRVGLTGILDFLSVSETMEHWRSHNGCNPMAQEFFRRGDATCVRWSGCRDNAEVALCTIDRGGHTWPGGVPIPFLGRTSSDLSATETMLDFFAAHPMR